MIKDLPIIKRIGWAKVNPGGHDRTPEQLVDQLLSLMDQAEREHYICDVQYEAMIRMADKAERDLSARLISLPRSASAIKKEILTDLALTKFEEDFNNCLLALKYHVLTI